MFLMSMTGAFFTSVAPLALLAGLAGVGPEREALARLGAQSLAVSARAAVDFRYEEIAVSEGGSELAYLGVTVGLPAEAGRPGCEVRIARIEFGEASLGPDQASLRATLSGVEAAEACLKPQEAMMAAALGSDALKIDRAEIAANYEIGPSRVLATAALHAPYGRVDVEFLADRLHLIHSPPAAVAPAPAPAPAPGEGGRPSAKTPRAADPDWPQNDWAEAPANETRLEGRLLRAEARLSLAPELAAMASGLAGGPEAIEAGVREGLGGELRRGGGLSPAGQALVDSAARELSRVASEGGDLVLTLAPPDSTRLSALADIAGPQQAVEALRPVFGAAPARLAALADPAEFEAALAGPEGLPAARRLELAKALATGEGAPRSPDAARRILASLAEAGDSEAALILAGLTLEAGEAPAAYAQALSAGAGGLAAARGLLDRAEAQIGLEAALKLQAAAAKPSADALLDQAKAGDLGAIGRLARAAAEGRGRPRDYAEALTWAGIAAAAGDFGAAALREGLRRRFADEANLAAWRGLASSAEAETLKLWMGGLAQSLKARATP